MATETITVWTWDYDHDEPVETRCAKSDFGYPNLDYDGRKMFYNTHFLTIEEAWKELLANARASEALRASNYRTHKETLRRVTEELAEAAEFAVRVSKRYEDWKKEQDAASPEDPPTE